MNYTLIVNIRSGFFYILWFIFSSRPFLLCRHFLFETIVIVLNRRGHNGFGVRYMLFYYYYYYYVVRHVIVHNIILKYRYANFYQNILSRPYVAARACNSCRLPRVDNTKFIDPEIRSWCDRRPHHHDRVNVVGVGASCRVNEWCRWTRHVMSYIHLHWCKTDER